MGPVSSSRSNGGTTCTMATTHKGFSALHLSLPSTNTLHHQQQPQTTVPQQRHPEQRLRVTQATDTWIHESNIAATTALRLRPDLQPQITLQTPTHQPAISAGEAVAAPAPSLPAQHAPLQHLFQLVPVPPAPPATAAEFVRPSTLPTSTSCLDSGSGVSLSATSKSGQHYHQLDLHALLSLNDFSPRPGGSMTFAASMAP